MVADIFGVIGDVITNFATALSNVFTSVGGLFYTPGSNGSPGEVSMLGILLLVGAGVGIVYWAIRLIRKLVARA